jgi:hypothetical protein
MLRVFLHLSASARPPPFSALRGRKIFVTRIKTAGRLSSASVRNAAKRGEGGLPIVEEAHRSLLACANHPPNPIERQTLCAISRNS